MNTTAGLVAAILVLAVTGCSSDDEPTTAPVPSATTTTAASPPEVVFFAEGTDTKSGSITLRTESGGTIQKDVALPMTNTSTGKPGLASTQFKSGDFLYISLQNSQGYGSVTCRIEVDGVELDKATSSGGYKIASCQATMP